MHSKFVIVGAGDVARFLLASPLRSEILAVADNNTSKHGTDFHGFEVSSVNDAVAKYGIDANYLVCVYNGSQVREQLAGLGCINIKPFVTYWREHPGELPKLACLMDESSAIDDESSDVNAALSIWGDEESKASYISLVQFHSQYICRWVSGYRPVLDPRPMSEMYFDERLFELRNDDVFLDCGAYDGDTVRDILARLPEFEGQILCSEPDQQNYTKLLDYICSLDRHNQILTSPCAVGAESGELQFSQKGTMGSALDTDGDVTVRVMTIDAAVSQTTLPTYIKMDIEGAEIDALNGAAETIKDHAPILAICVYHKLSDLWRIPLLIKKLNPDYKLYLRRYAEDCWETVCYAVPPGRSLPKGLTKTC